MTVNALVWYDIILSYDSYCSPAALRLMNLHKYLQLVYLCKEYVEYRVHIIIMAANDDDDRKPSARAAGDDESDVEMEGEYYLLVVRVGVGGWDYLGSIRKSCHTSLSLPYCLTHNSFICHCIHLFYADLLYALLMVFL